MSDQEPKEEKPPVVEVARPDIAAPAVDSLGRSMANKRGRKPGPQAPRAEGATQKQTLSKELGKRLPQNVQDMSDAVVGEAIAGAFAAIGLAAGPHWRLFESEKVKLGETFGPIARLFGTDALAQAILVMMCIPVTAEVMAPRLAIQGMIRRGEMKKEEARSTLLNIKGMMQAEKSLNIEEQALESEAMGREFLRAQVKAGMDGAAQVKAEQLKSEGLV